MQELQDRLDREFFPHLSSTNPITQKNLQVLLYLAVALCGEAGELANEIKKVYRGDAPLAEKKEAIARELADVLIYTLKMCTQTSTDLERAFLDKLDYNRRRFSSGLSEPTASEPDNREKDGRTDPPQPQDSS